ncbi:hypothetical protein [Actinosynnema sp. NPDC020468]|uniref:hypothetical protein n=1 Tax=Actinosynnema sp. NPDC020468 TaxID=3154488 RepID=UPI00340F18F8
MPRPMLGNTSATSSRLSGPRATTASNARHRVSTTKRSREYQDALRALDTSGHVGAVDLSRLVDDVRREFDDAHCTTPFGIVSRCYLGEPYEVHTLALDHSILEHYELGRPLPGGLERARPVAVSAVYAAVEVYADRLVCVRLDGSVVALGSEA